MPNDDEALDAKRREIADFVERAISSVVGKPQLSIEPILDSFASLTPPIEPEETEMMAELITILSPSSTPKGRSRKPGNITLSWRKLIELVPDAGLAAAGAETSPHWLWPLIGLYVWNKLWRGAEEKLSDIEATTILALWKNKNGENKISEDEGYAATNAVRNGLKLPLLSRTEFNSAINHLLRIDCIKMDQGIIWLREWVRVSYD